MDDKRIAICVLLSGMTLGFASFASPSVWAFADGFLGLPASPGANEEANALNADLAAQTLSTPLQDAEFDELLQGISYHAQERYGEAIPIIGRYAMRGDTTAQTLVGAMYAFGHGLPIDRVEALRWLNLAANQGDHGAILLASRINASPDWERRAAALAFATKSNPEWSQPEVAPQEANRGGLPPMDFGPGLPTQSPSYNGSTYGAGNPYSIGTMVSPASPIGARASMSEAYGSGSASRGLSSAPIGTPSVGATTPMILNRAGPGTYSDGSGDIYTQAGPHGVVNTRTDEFSTTN